MSDLIVTEMLREHVPIACIVGIILLPRAISVVLSRWEKRQCRKDAAKP